MTTLTIPTVAITFAPIAKVEDNKATRKLATEEAVRTVNRAVNAWYYNQG